MTWEEAGASKRLKPWATGVQSRFGVLSWF